MNTENANTKSYQITHTMTKHIIDAMNVLRKYLGWDTIKLSEEEVEIGGIAWPGL